MTLTKRQHCSTASFRRLQACSPLALAILISACGESGTIGAGSQSGPSASVGTTKSSTSADQLASEDDSVVTVGKLLAQELNAEGSSFSSSASLGAANPNNETPETQFSSELSPGFTGEVLNDSIRISWQADPQASGYNINRQGSYHATVSEAEFIDEDVFDEDYYYEIKAFYEGETGFTDVAAGLTVAARTLGRPNPNPPETNDALLDDYELVFGDEFTGTQLDTSKWDTSFIWGTDMIINSEEQYYVDIKNEPDFGFNPFTMDGENLVITTVETPDALLADANDQEYLSGIITSYESFKFTYGYVETRAKLPYGRGYWPAFWLLNAYYGSDGSNADPEIDIMEYIGDEIDAVHHTYHYHDSDDQLRSSSTYTKGMDFVSNFHTFAVQWEPDLLVFFVDGIERYRITDVNVSTEEMYVLANTAVGGWWAGPPDETTPFPNTYEIDYIRVYQKITPSNDLQLDQSDDIIPLFADSIDTVTPNRRPSLEQWPANLR